MYLGVGAQWLICTIQIQLHFVFDAQVTNPQSLTLTAC